jgi:hypothetical protein
MHSTPLSASAIQDFIKLYAEHDGGCMLPFEEAQHKLEGLLSLLRAASGRSSRRTVQTFSKGITTQKKENEVQR